jgi:hypothetical protein
MWPIQQALFAFYHHNQFFSSMSYSSSSSLEYAHDPILLEGCRQARQDFRMMDVEPSNPPLDPPQPSQPLEVPVGPSNSPEFSPQVFTETPISQPQQRFQVHQIFRGPGGIETKVPIAMDTLVMEAGTPPSPQFFPPGKKLPKKKALSESSDLSIFNILNIFHCCWFLSVNSLRAQALSAQKAEDGNILWVKFSPQFHAHLVKSAVTLIPQPIQKVKKVLFVFILELLNGKGPQAFFDLLKGVTTCHTVMNYM